jgi:hypothetical protein
MKRTIEQKSEQCELVCNQSMFTSLMRYKCNYLTDFKRKFLSNKRKCYYVMDLIKLLSDRNKRLL